MLRVSELHFTASHLPLHRQPLTTIPPATYYFTANHLPFYCQPLTTSPPATSPPATYHFTASHLPLHRQPLATSPPATPPHLYPAFQCKAAYERACQEADKSSEILQQNMTQPQKKVDQLKSKMKICRETAETAGSLNTHFVAH